MQKKLYRMEDETLEIMREFMQSRGFYSETQAINFIILDYAKTLNEKLDIDKALDKKLKPLIASQRKLEKELHTIKDVVNTIIFEHVGITQLLPADDEEGNYKHRILRESEERYDRNIAKLKKNKDNDNQDKWGEYING